MPDVGVDLAVNVFELVQLGDRGAAIFDVDVADLAESGGIEEAERRGAVAQDQVLAVLGEPPAFAVVVKVRSRRKLKRS